MWEQDPSATDILPGTRNLALLAVYCLQSEISGSWCPYVNVTTMLYSSNFKSTGTCT